MRKLVIAILITLYAYGCFAGEPVPESWNADKKLKKKLESRQLVLASEAIEGFPSNAVVVLGYFKRKQRNTTVTWPRAAFAIGDGSLLVTAAHCVTDFDDNDSQAISRETVAISPYYGDVYGIEVVAIDKKADVAILKAGWKNHPALELADEKGLSDEKKLITAGYPPPFILNSNNDKIDSEFSMKLSRKVKSEVLPLKRLTDKGPKHAFVLLATRFLGPGWSGSPMLSSDGKVAGVICSLSPIRRNKTISVFGIPIFSKKDVMVARNASGCSVSSIKNLIDKHSLQKAAYSKPGEYEPIENSAEAFSAVLEYIEAYLKRDLETAFDVGKKLVALRENSARMHLLLAEEAQYHYLEDSTKKQLPSVIDKNYKTALQLDPNCATAYATYASFLSSQKRYDEALAETEKALAIDEDNQLALVERMRMLMKEDIEQAEKLALRLTDTYPKVAHYWNTYSSILRSQKKYEAALTAAQNAIDLRPDGLYYGQLGRVYEELGSYDQAEINYKKMSVNCACQHCLWEYSNFLIKYRPNKLPEAEEILNAAEKKKARRVSQDNLDYTRLSLLEKKSAKKAEVFCRKLLDRNPEKGIYWHRMAGILRTLKKHNEALEAIQKAVSICSDCNYDPRLANILGKTGKLDEAQKVYDKMLDEHPERQKYWFWYTEFLVDYFPKRKEDARHALTRALENDKQWKVDKKQLEKMCLKLSVDHKGKENSN